MANTTYQNFILESKLNDVLNTKLNAKTLMTIDGDLSENAGMKKVVNRYSYDGVVEQVAAGSGNTQDSSVGFKPYDYEVLVYQQRLPIRDEEVMTDPNVLDFGITGAADTMIKHMNDQYMAELNKATLDEDYSTVITYDDIVDAIEKLTLEDESALYIIGGTKLRAAIRKDDDFVAAKQGEIIFSGHIGFVAGIPVVISKLIGENEAYVVDRSAIKLFVKKDSEVGQERDEDKRTTSYFFRRVGLVALVNATKVVRLAAANTSKPTIVTKAGTTVAGACVAKCDYIGVYVNGKLVAEGTYNAEDTDAYSVAVPALASGAKVSVYARPTGKIGVWSDEATVA